MKVLIYCPMNPIAPRICDRTLDSIFGMRWMHPLDIVFGREDMPRLPSRPVAHTNITRKYNDARRMALEGGYDALMTIEADMIVPDLALLRMSAVAADVVYGLYSNRHGRHQWLAFQTIGGLDGNYSGHSYSKDPVMCARAWGNVVESVGVGLGCTLIRRNVLEAIEFRCAPDQQVANDWMLALDVGAAGFTQAHDCGVVCGHIDGNVVYWPVANGGYRPEKMLS